MLDDGENGRKIDWHVYGQGSITLYRGGKAVIHRTGEHFQESFSS
jgi:hypothetical protein